MAGQTPAPRRGAHPFSVPLTVHSGSARLGIMDKGVYVETSTGPKVLKLPDVRETPEGSIYLIEWGGGGGLTLQPEATDNVVPPSGGAGVPVPLTADSIRTLFLVSDPLNQQWRMISAVNPSAMSAFVGSTRGFAASALSAQVGDVRSTTIQQRDGSGAVAIAPQSWLRVRMWDDDALTVPSVAGTLTVGGSGTVISGAGTNDVILQLGVDGSAIVNADDGAAAPASHWISIEVRQPAVNNSGFYYMGCYVVSGAWT